MTVRTGGRRTLRGLGVLAVATTVPVLVAAGTASAASGRLTQQVVCAGQPITIAVAPGNDGNNWGSAQVDGGGHLVLATLEYAVRDDTAGVVLDDEVLTHGKAHGQQDAVACDVASEQFVLGDVAPPDFAYPPGTGPADTVTSTLRATVVPRP
ncbi:MAG: hypothetical protein ACXV3S_09880 [Kineosporiaceae bacterium]